MIHTVQGDIFNAKTEAIVNPVNCVGVMGKGSCITSSISRQRTIGVMHPRSPISSKASMLLRGRLKKFQSILLPSRRLVVALVVFPGTS